MTHVLLGALVAVGFAVAVRVLAPRREAAVYALGLVVAAALYVAFALAARELGWAAIGAVGLVFFALFAALGLRATPLLLATGWALHVGWDAALHQAGTGHFVPSGYPALCVGFDLVLAVWIAIVRPRVGTASPAPVLGKVALRDGLILGATLLLWRADALWRSAGGSVETLLAVPTGVATALCGYLAHEWGHLLGARASRSLVHLPASPWTVFLFRFDSDRNTRSRFLAMSCGGYAASAFVVVLLVFVLPLDALAGRIALALTVLGVLATAILELPPAWHVLRGGPIPRGAAYASGAREVSESDAHDHPIRGRFHAWFLSATEDALERIHGKRKRRIFASLPYELVEIGPGVGANFRHYVPGTRVIGFEPNLRMHEALRRSAEERGVELEIRGPRGESLDLPSESCDAVVCTLVLCSVDDPARVVAEALRVLRPGGRFVFIEHVAAPPGTALRRLQNGIQPLWSWCFEGCRPNRHTEEVLQKAGFSGLDVERFRVRSLFIHVAPHIAGVGVK